MPEYENEWIDFFRHHAPDYMTNVFTENTEAEVAFILRELEVEPGARILDMGCGTGRHSIELAKHGMQVTGVDISPHMLEEAKLAAKEADVGVTWICTDALDYQAEEDFEGAICICEGGFGLLGSQDDPHRHDLEILGVIARSLQPGGNLILTALNALRPIRKTTPRDINTGTFDPLTMVETGTMEITTPQGARQFTTRERSFTPTELVLMHQIAGLEVRDIYGGTAGAWGKRPLELDEMEIMVISIKGTLPD